MIRPPRAAEGGLIYHAMNRAADVTIFGDGGDYAPFPRVVAEAATRGSTRVLAHRVMPDHFRLVLWPRGDGDLSRFGSWVG